jgi:probable HAF family extracellular repeat protein
MKRFALSVVVAVSVVACSEPTRPSASPAAQADVAAAPSTDYAVTDLGSLGGTFAAALRINAGGVVVGASTTATGEQHAFRWTQATGMVDLGTLPGATGSFAWGINSQGDVAGEADLPSGDTRAVLWTADGKITDLGTLGGPSALAFAVNNGGEVIGFSSLATGGPTHAFVWTAQGGMVDIGTFNGTNTRLRTINNAGTAAGSGNLASGGHAHAVLWQPSTGFQDLGTLGNDPSFAATINDLGVVVGFSATADVCCHAFRWTQATGMVDLGALSGPDGNSYAVGLNHRGQVVGATTTQADPGNVHAFIWSQSGGMRQLVEGVGEFDSEALGINEAGLIVGDGDTPDGRGHALLWRPVAP